ncbi:IucA/IucC family protein [Vibrio barjaei]|uniref:IucA/IucC family protein n=1 Tax=Vibrio barjaei TaxID=1676683 RepID=UPI002283A966|nr:IucA/IucC family protein [Vibrio barjaei]MCY9871753.1 IucA/IucC family siderophore biosynthesis protein [Vibrio barjaei]
MDASQAISQYWSRANRNLVAKIISEFHYEGAYEIGETSDSNLCAARIGNAQYHFQGRKQIWGSYRIDADSLVRVCEEQNKTTIEANLLLADLKLHLSMSDHRVAEHVEDMNATLYSDCLMMAENAKRTASDMCSMSLIEQQAAIAGHPKFAFNKGRRGWGVSDLEHYAPEFSGHFQLVWLAIRRASLQVGITSGLNWNHDLVASMLSPSEMVLFENKLAADSLNPEDYLLIPVHPWQWENKLAMAYIKEISDKTLVYLGGAGKKVSPQLSIRTLSVIDNSSGIPAFDIKLPLTIMNTSCYRGIPSRYIQAGPYASSWIKQKCETDLELQLLGTQALEEPASAYLASSAYSQLQDAPYRFHELLGVIWRESAESKLEPGEHAYLMALLFELDSHGQPVVIELINQSGLTATQWLEKLFTAVVIPYYHLLVKYGISLIAHGQNVTVVCRDGTPERILLKDFQGDMRLVQTDIPELDALPDIVKQVTTRLPEELIIHDLQTGHFVTVLRFLSPLLEKIEVTELEFYSVLARTIRQYQARHPELASRYEALDLFKPQILKLGLNLSKFRHDTDNSSDRMLPDMDLYMDNPLYFSER